MKNTKPVFWVVVITLLITMVVLLVLIVLNLNKYEYVNANKKDFVVGLVTHGPGLGDKGFTDSAYQALKMAKKEFGIEYKMIQQKVQGNYYENLTKLAYDGADMVFAFGFLMEKDIKDATKDFPNTIFAGIDMAADKDSPDNFMGIMFSENEASFLAGIVAGLMTDKYSSAILKLNDENTIGVVLGMDVPPVIRYESGYIAGAKSVNPNVKVLSATVGDFYAKDKGKDAAFSMIDAGADIIFHAAGMTGLGVIEACKERGVLAIGVDVDQNDVAPDTVLTSAEKNIVQATFLAIESVYYNKFTGGTTVLTIKDDAVGISDFHSFNLSIPQAVKDAVKKAKDDIKFDRITIPKTRVEVEEMFAN